MINISSKELNELVGEFVGNPVEYIGIVVDEKLQRVRPLKLVFWNRGSAGNPLGVIRMAEEHVSSLIKNKNKC